MNRNVKANHSVEYRLISRSLKLMLWFVSVVLMTTCKQESAQKRGTAQSAANPAADSPANQQPAAPATPGVGSPTTTPDDPLAQLQKDCGIQLADLADPNKVIFQARYRSLPITISGSIFIINYSVVVQAVLDILSKNSGGSQSVTVSVLDAKPQLLAKSRAEKAAQAASSSSQSTGVTQDEMSKIGSTNKQFDGLLCALTATKESSSSSTGSFSYEPGLPATISPFASIVEQQKEIGQGRDFDVVVNVKSSTKGLAAGSKISGHVSVRPVDPRLTYQQNGQSVTLTAKAAYSVQNMFQDEKTTVALGMPLTTTFFVNAELKKFMAIVADTGQQMEGKRLQPTLFLPE